MKAPHLVLLFDVALAALGVLLADAGRTIPAISVFAALGLLVVWQVLLFSAARSPFRVEVFFIRTHYVQAVLHLSMYTYLGLYWPAVGRSALLIATQIVLAYLCDMLLAWSRGRAWRLGFGAVPIVLSTNLFLWFRDDYFYLQLALIALAFFSKEFITWTYQGRRRHIFNPSAFPLSVVSVVLLTIGHVDTTYGIEIATAFEIPPNFYEVIFLLGLVVQLFFVVTPVSFGAALSLYVVFLASGALLGEPLSTVPIQAAVFLGMTFLVTDPATSPRTAFGRFLFGMAYGVGVMLTFVLLRLAHQPSFFDKLLVVPVVNLMLPLFDRVSDWCIRRAPWLSAPTPGHVARFGWAAAYILLFLLMVPALKAPKTRRPTLLPPPAGRIDAELLQIMRNHVYCRFAFPEAYRPFGFRSEWEHLNTLRAIYRYGPPADGLRSGQQGTAGPGAP